MLSSCGRAEGLDLDIGGAQARMRAPGTKSVEGLGASPAFDAIRDVLAECRAMLEAVARAAADQPPVRVLGVGGDDEMRVDSEVVLADARADDRRLSERRET